VSVSSLLGCIFDDMTIVDPPDGTVFAPGVPVMMSAMQFSCGGKPVPAWFYSGTNLLGMAYPASDTVMVLTAAGTVATKPYTMVLTNLTPGNYYVTVKPQNRSEPAYNQRVHITVLPADIPPSVRILSLLAYGSASKVNTFTQGATVRLEAEVIPSASTVQQVNFYVEQLRITRTNFYYTNILVAAVTNAPYAYVWTNAVSGPVTAEVIDIAGGRRTSGVALLESARQAGTPAVNITFPPDGTRVALGANLPVSAFLVSSDNNLNPVEFYVGTNLVGSVLNPPYQIVLSNLAVGTYALSAQIKSLTGLASTGAVAQVTVSDFLLHPAGMDHDGNFHLRVGGVAAGTTNVVEASPDLLVWAPLVTNLVTTNYVDFVDPGAGNDCQRFYRCVRVP
jgi:hypothetical protein